MVADAVLGFGISVCYLQFSWVSWTMLKVACALFLDRAAQGGPGGFSWPMGWSVIGGPRGIYVSNRSPTSWPPRLARSAKPSTLAAGIFAVRSRGALANHVLDDSLELARVLEATHACLRGSRGARPTAPCPCPAALVAPSPA